MKRNARVISIVTAGVLAFCGAGCHKQSASSERPKSLNEGVIELQAALVNASPQAQSNFYNGVSYGIRYSDYAKALAALQQIASDPSLNDQQKKLVSDVGDLLQQKQNSPKP